MRKNRVFRLAARPVGLPKASDWSFTTDEPVTAPGDGQFLVEVSHISLDPAMRGWMNEGKSYVPPVGIGEVMRAGAIGKVIESAHPRFPVGSSVSGLFGVQHYALSDGKAVSIVDTAVASEAAWLNALGMPGLTAYFGFLDVGKPRPGDTVLVSAAAGAVGSLVVQIAKDRGCRVVGIAGGAEKCAWVKELGAEACLDYKAGDIKKALRDACPKGVDVYFDNVGGDILDAALANLARGARVVICGAISQYNNTTPVKGPANYLSLLVNRASMTGMVVFDFAARYGEGLAELARLRREGKLHSKEDVEKGLERFPEVLLKLFSGENTGKLVLAV